MKIQILGTGCTKCNNLTEAAKKAAEELGVEYDLEKVTDIKEIISMGVMATPGLVVDGKILSTGKLPSVAEIKEMLK